MIASDVSTAHATTAKPAARRRRRRVKPRKRPSTRSGQAILEAILEAAEKILAAEGLAGLTTNRIAERAGVSIGSLYQYFPNKDAILTQLACHMEQRTQRLIIEALVKGAGESLVEIVGRVVDVLLGEALAPLKMRRALRLAVPSDWTLETAGGVDAQVRGAVAAALAGRPDVRGGDSALMSFVVCHAIEQIVESAIVAAPELLTSPAFRDELVRLVVSFIGADAGAPPTAPSPRAPR